MLWGKPPAWIRSQARKQPRAEPHVPGPNWLCAPYRIGLFPMASALIPCAPSGSPSPVSPLTLPPLEIRTQLSSTGKAGCRNDWLTDAQTQPGAPGS